MRHILIVKMSSLGDLHHALPVVHALKTGLKAEIDWVVHDIYADYARHFRDVRRVIAFPRTAFWERHPEFRRELRADRYDLVVDLQGLMKSALVARLARGRRRIGPSFHREAAFLLYDTVAGPRNRRRHAVEECMDVLDHLGLPRPARPAFPLAFPPAPLAGPRPRIAIVPRSRRPEKNWPVERFAAVTRELVARGATVFVLGGKADADAGRALAAAGAQDLCGQTGLVDLARHLAAMDLVVTVDSGPMHMAAALGIPVVAVFGPTDPVRVGPYGPGHVVVRAGNLIEDTPVESVLAAVRSVLPQA